MVSNMEGVEIVIKPIHLERFIYAIVIIALAILLIIKWNGGACDVATDTTATTTTTTTNQTNQTANTTQTSDLCSNAIKDQDETDVDCGGASCPKCAEFKSCNVNADCASAYCHQSIKCMTPTCDDGVKNKNELSVDCGGHCTATKGEFFYDGACHKEVEPQLSGEVEVSILNVETSVNADSQLAKIDGVTFNVSNGKATTLSGAKAYIYARTSTGQPYFINTQTSEERVYNYPTPPIDIPALDSGEVYTYSVNYSKTLTETEADENYRVVIQIRDDDDNLIDETTWTNS